MIDGRAWSHATERIFNARTLLPFLVGSICVAIIGDVVLLMALRATGESFEKFLAVGGAAALCLWVMVTWFRWSLGRITLADDELSNKQQPDSCRGLILMVSNEATCEQAFAYHRETLEHVWLIRSERFVELAETV